MAEALGLVVAVVVGKIVVVFRAPVMGQLQHGLAPERVSGSVGVIRGHTAGLPVIKVAQEIEGKLHFREVQLTHQPHSHHPGIEVHGAPRIFDAQHGLVEYIAFRFRNRFFMQAGGLFKVLGHRNSLFHLEKLRVYICVRFGGISRALRSPAGGSWANHGV